MTDAEKLWGQVQEVYQLSVGDDEPYSFDGVVAVSFSEAARILTLQAEDVSEALYLSTQFSDPLITALESIVGPPAYIECVYNPQTPKHNHQFTVRRTDEDYIIDASDEERPKSALEMMVEDINDQRVSELELK